MTQFPCFVSLFCLMVVALPCSAAPACGNLTDPAAVVQAQVDAYNRHDVESFLSCYADLVTIYRLDGTKAPVQGMEALRKAYAFLGTIPSEGAGYGVDIVAKTVTGPTVANVEHLRGLPPGKPSQPDVLVIYEVRDGKILNVWFAPSR